MKQYHVDLLEAMTGLWHHRFTIEEAGELIDKAIEAAVAEERERCKSIVDEVASHYGQTNQPPFSHIDFSPGQE